MITEILDNLMTNSTPEDIFDKYLRDSFVSIGTNPTSWLMFAQEYKRAADILLDQIKKDFFEKSIGNWPKGNILEDDNIPHPIEGICAFLFGMAIENLLKGIDIARTNFAMSKDFKEWIKKHQPRP